LDVAPVAHIDDVPRLELHRIAGLEVDHQRVVVQLAQVAAVVEAPLDQNPHPLGANPVLVGVVLGVRKISFTSWPGLMLSRCSRSGMRKVSGASRWRASASSRE